MEWIEVTPHYSQTTTMQAMQELLALLHQHPRNRSLREKILGIVPVFLFEVNTTKSNGIRFQIGTSPSMITSLTKLVEVYMPDAQIKGCVPLMPTPHSKSQSIHFRQTKSFAFPLRVPTESTHDPLAYVLGTMANVASDEEIRYRLKISPIKLRRAKQLYRMLLDNTDILFLLDKKSGRISNGKTLSLSSMLLGVTETVTTLFGTHRKAERPTSRETRDYTRPARVLSQFEQTLLESMQDKLKQPLFRVGLEITVIASTNKAIRKRLRTFGSSFSSLNQTGYQLLRPTRTPASHLILSASELASLYHFPSLKNARIDNLQTRFSRTLPAPVSLKNGNTLDVYIGQNEHHNILTPIGLTERERERHMFIVGGTGNGKTTMLQYMITQDIQNGKGVIVIDPHGDMAVELLKHITDERRKDLIYFNPDDLDYPFGLNLLELDSRLKGNDLLREKDLITESVISIFRKLFSEDDSGGHRIEYILRNAIQTALTLKDSTIFTVYDLLNDKAFRNKVRIGLEDGPLKNFWRYEFGRAGDMQRVKMAAGVTSKIGRFLFSASAKVILEQPVSTLHFDEILDSNKILICNFSKGLLGEDTAALFGVMTLAQIQLVSLRRARLEIRDRKPTYVYVDEFQNFATPSFVQMLSESRKYKIYLTMAEQSTSQQSDKDMIHVLLANVGTVVVFRTGNPEDEQLLLPLFSPYISKNEILNLSPYQFYIRLSGERSQEHLSGITTLIDRRATTI